MKFPNVTQTISGLDTGYCYYYHSTVDFLCLPSLNLIRPCVLKRNLHYQIQPRRKPASNASHLKLLSSLYWEQLAS